MSVERLGKAKADSIAIIAITIIISMRVKPAVVDFRPALFLERKQPVKMRFFGFVLLLKGFKN
jgi:hypothetical protein